MSATPIACFTTSPNSAASRPSSAVGDTVGQVTNIATSAQEMARGAERVVLTMMSINAAVEESSAATEEMAAQAAQVTTSIQAIASLVGESSAATEEVSASSQEMLAYLFDLREQAQELAQTASSLQALVARFQLNPSDGDEHDTDGDSTRPAPRPTSKVA